MLGLAVVGTKAQQRSVVKVPAPDGGEPTFLHLSNNYVPGPGGAGTCTNEGLLYWYPLQFADNGTLLGLTWEDEVRFEAAVPPPSALASTSAPERATD